MGKGMKIKKGGEKKAVVIHPGGEVKGRRGL